MIRHRRRVGYTLLEVILVLAVLVIAASLTYPSLRAMRGYYNLQGAVDAVRAAWAQARAHAIEEGRPYRFAVEQDGNHFRVAPDQAEFWDGGSGEGGYVLQQALPAGVRFSVNGQSADLPPEDEREEESEPKGEWVPTATFLPDGSAHEDVQITFEIRGARPTTLYLRGLTGSVTVLTPER